jgi:glycosyltransferase involved in cell wall biosynthesis
MRVIHVITRLIVGGAQENTLASVLGLRAHAGWDVELISGPSTGPEGCLLSKEETAADWLTVIPELVRPIHPWLDVVAWTKLVRQFREHRPSIVHTHSGKAGFLGRLAARRARVPIIVHTIHGPSFGAFQGFLANGCFRSAERLAARSTTHFVSVSDAMTRQYLAAGIGLPRQYSRILSGFPLGPFLQARNTIELRQKLGLGAEHVIITKIARLFKLKGHDELIEAAAAIVPRCPMARFLFIGDGTWRERLLAKVRRLNLESKVVFTGLVPPSQIPALIGVSDVVVHLSRREGLPRALPQAMAAAKPIVAYDCDGAAEVCLDQTTGFLIPPGDQNLLQQRLLELVTDPPLRQRMGEHGRRLATQLFAVETMVEALAALYDRLLQSSTQPTAPSLPKMS